MRRALVTHELSPRFCCAPRLLLSTSIKRWGTPPRCCAAAAINSSAAIDLSLHEGGSLRRARLLEKYLAAAGGRPTQCA